MPTDEKYVTYYINIKGNIGILPNHIKEQYKTEDDMDYEELEDREFIKLKFQTI